MHELARMGGGAYQDAFTTVAAWLAGHLDPALVGAWCPVFRKAGTGSVALLDAPGRPVEPVLLLDWRTA